GGGNQRRTIAWVAAALVTAWLAQPGDVHAAVCGDTVIEAGEQCDDGNTVPGDCCSATCQYEASGDPCPEDGNTCTFDRCNSTGVCTHPAIGPGFACRP